MSNDLILFCALVCISTLFSTVGAYPVSQAETIYQMLDQPSWVVGGILAIAIGFWKPWFTTSWWKAILSSFFLPIVMASVGGAFLGLLLTMDTSHTRLVVARLTILSILVILTFLCLRAC